MGAKKVKSKRLNTALRAKIHRKSQETHRKQAKEAKSRPGHQKRMKKDPGIPANLPFKDKVMRDIELAREKIRVDKEMRKLQRKAAAQIGQPESENEAMEDVSEEHALAGSSAEQRKLLAMAQSAAKRGQVYENRVEDDSPADIGFYQLPDHSRKSYFKEFKKVVELSDVILEVLDARDPLGSRVSDIERMILESGTAKRLILILNKIDLVPKENALAWIKYLKNEFPTIAFKCCTSQNQRQKRTPAPASSDGAALSVPDTHRPSESFGAESLIQLLKNYCRNVNIKTSITVGVIGFPNVGKSSLINSLKRARVCPTGSTPGLTRATQEVYLDSNIKLLDSPGVVFTIGTHALEESHNSLLLRNCLRVEQLEDPILPVQLIVAKCPKSQLMLIYHLAEYDDHLDFLHMVAKKLGKLKKGGIPDLESAARIIVSDWNAGKIPFYTVPPSRAHEQLDAQLVSQWSSEFSLDSYQPDVAMELEDEAATDFIQLMQDD